MPARKPFKKSIASIQPEPIPPPEVVFSTLPLSANESTPADNTPDGPTLVPDGYASSSRGAVFVDLNTNRLIPAGQSAGVQLEKDANTFLGVKTSPRRCDLLSISTPFLDIPDRELSELVETRRLENGLDEADLELIGATVPSVTGSLSESRASVSRIMNGITDLIIHSEKPLVSLDILESSKEIVSSIQDSVTGLDLPCEKPNYDIQDLCGIEDDANVQSSTRILAIALAAVANDGDPGSEFVIKATNSASLKLAGKTLKFVTSMKSSSVGKTTKSKSAENPNSASSQNSIKKISVKSPSSSVGRTLVKSSNSDDSRFQIPVTAVADRWDDIDQIIKQSERVVVKFKNYDNFDLARQGKPTKNATSALKSTIASGLGGVSSAVSLSGSGSANSTKLEEAQAYSKNSAGSNKAAISGKSGRSTSRSSTIGAPAKSSGSAGSSTSSSSKGTLKSGVKSSAGTGVKGSGSAISSAIKGATEKSSSRSSIIISRLCSTIASVLRREMMLSRASAAGLKSDGKTDTVTAFTRSLISAKSSVSNLSLLNVGSSCRGQIISTHIDDKKSVSLLEPRLFSGQKRTYTGAYENLIVPAVKFPGNIAPLVGYVDNLRSNVVSPIDQLLNLMLVDIANVMTPTVVLRTAFLEISAALSSLEEIINEDGGGVANEQIIELICMNLYADPNFKTRSKRVIYEKFLSPDKQFSFDGSSGSVSSKISNPDTKTIVKTKTTADGETTESISEVETKDQSGEDDDSASSPTDFSEDLLNVRKTLSGQSYSGYNDDAAAKRAGSLTFQTRTSEMLDAFGKTGDFTTLSQAVISISEKLIETCEAAMGSSIMSDDEIELRETGLSLNALKFMIFDLVSEICRSFYFLYIFKDTGSENYEGTSKEDPSFTISLKSPKSEKGDYLNPNECFDDSVASIISNSTGALLEVREVSKGAKITQSVAKEIQEYENGIRDHYARVFALNEIFDSIHQSFDEFRNLLTGGDVGFARQQLSARGSTRKTIELLDRKVLSECRWRFDSRLRSVFDKTSTTIKHEIDCVQHFFKTRNSIVSDDVIGNSLNSLLCVVGIPFGMSQASSQQGQLTKSLINVSLSKRDVEFQGLIFDQQSYSFDPNLKVIVRPASLSDTFQALVERRTQYYTFDNGVWTVKKYQDVLKGLVTNKRIDERSAQQIIRNHVIDFMAKCFLRHVSLLEYSCDNLFKAQKRVSTTAPSIINTINSILPIAPVGTSLANFLKLAVGGYELTVGPHAVDGSNEADARLIYRLMQDPALSGDFLIEEVFGTLPYETTYCIVVDPDTFKVKVDSKVPAASYSSIIESLGEVTSIKDPGEGLIVSTKTGKYMRQRDQIRRFSGSEIAVTCEFTTKSSGKPMQFNKEQNKTNKSGFRTASRRS